MLKKDPLIPSANSHYAGLLPRFFALVIDFLFLSFFFFPATRLIKGVWIMSAADHHWSGGWFITDPLCLIFLVVIFGYFVLCEGFAGATLGKKILHIRVVSSDNEKPGLFRALIRNFLRVVDSLPAFNILGVVLILLSPERARFGDRIGGTRVIYNK